MYMLFVNYSVSRCRTYKLAINRSYIMYLINMIFNKHIKVFTAESDFKTFSRVLRYSLLLRIDS